MEKNKLVPVILKEYDSNWKDAFNDMKAKILYVLPNITIEHIGSTAIEGMVAKPEIDILIGVDDINNVSGKITILETLGFEYFPKFEEQVPERRYLRLSKGIVPLFHIHLVEKTSVFYMNHIKFRDYLIANPEMKDKYIALKKMWIEKNGDDRIKYSEAKKEFILNVINQIIYK